jgi:hypothetical protein
MSIDSVRQICHLVTTPSLLWSATAIFAPGLLYHAAIDLYLVAVYTSQSSLSIDAVDANEYQIHKNSAHVGNRLGTHQGESVSAQMTAGYKDMNIFPFT